MEALSRILQPVNEVTMRPPPTYNSHFPTKVVLDLARLDGGGRMFLDDRGELCKRQVRNR